jgi:capsule polysaccharide export protein KpsE/RkpR
VEARNAELQKQLDKLGGLNQKPESGGSSDYPSAAELPSLGVTYSDLERKMRVEEALWEALTKQYETAKVEEASEIPTITVLDAASVPERKSAPSRRLIILIGSLLSFIASCISVVAVTIWEGMAQEEEPKKLIYDIADAVFDRHRWYWSIPGLRWIYGRLRT